MDLWDLQNKKCKTQIAALFWEHHLQKKNTCLPIWTSYNYIVKFSEIMKGRNSMVKLEVKPFFAFTKFQTILRCSFTTSVVLRCTQLMKNKDWKFMYFDHLDMELL
jgi:hypothetical protein